MTLRILVRGGGDLASGVIIRLHRAGWQVLVTELAKPLAVRRLVSFAEAVYQGTITIETVAARLADSYDEVVKILADGDVAVFVDEGLSVLESYRPHVLVDARMRKAAPEVGKEAAPLVIGIGPGFTAGSNCHALVETNRGPFLGRVYWSGQAQDDTGIPERMGDFRSERVLRAPVNGLLEAAVEIGSHLKQGALIATTGGQPVTAPFDGVLRGLIHSGMVVRAGDKIGDLDPRDNEDLSHLVSDKALSIAGGVIEAILTWQPIRRYWQDG